VTSRGEQPAVRLDLDGPQLRGNRQGYRLGDEVVDGFPDRPSLPPFQRRLIAEWGKALGHTLTAAQEQLLAARPTPPAVQLEILRAAQRNSDHDVRRLADSGVYATLDPADVARCEQPWEVLGADRSYPLNASELATLTGTTYKQVRDWSADGLLPSYEIAGSRHYFSAAALTATALQPMDKWQVAALRGILTAEADSRFRRLVALVTTPPEDSGTGDDAGSYRGLVAGAFGRSLGRRSKRRDEAIRAAVATFNGKRAPHAIRSLGDLYDLTSAKPAESEAQVIVEKRPDKGYRVIVQEELASVPRQKDGLALGAALGLTGFGKVIAGRRTVFDPHEDVPVVGGKAPDGTFRTSPAPEAPKRRKATS
jgi:hypothetical protein